MTKPAILLTGATGLVGRFILRRLLEAGFDVATVVRAGTSTTPVLVGATSSAAASANVAQQFARRRVEQILQPFETNRLLTRPRVITWDFAASELFPPTGALTPASPTGADSTYALLSAEDWRWLNSRPLAVIHCAASIRFQRDEHSGEPYRTNVQGTQNLVNLCKRLPVCCFHHVSTAYVGDHRSGNLVSEVLATNPELGGNDYERSKIQAELLVTSQLDNVPIMIHRPSIVVGDSRSYFTSTFHGFYAPLQIGMQYAKLFGFSEQAGQWFRQQLGLKPQDSKNLVTVDWVAEGIFRAVESSLQELDNSRSGSSKSIGLSAGTPRVVHWTNPSPVACQQMQAAIVESIERKSRVSVEPKALAQSSAGLHPPSPEQFREQMRVYESYFQSDPLFSNGNASSIAPDLICPPVDYRLLLKLSEWAIDANFGWPKPLLPDLQNQSILHALNEINWLETHSGCTIVRVQLLGPGSPESLYFAVSADRCGRVSECTQWDQVWRLSLQSLTTCITDTTQLSETIRQGCWLIEGKRGQNALACAQNWINHIRKFLR